MKIEDILAANITAGLYFAESGDRVIYMPQHWGNEMRQDDEDDGICITCYYGNEDCLAFKEREGNEYESTDCVLLFSQNCLESFRVITEDEAKQLDPDLFELLDAINKGTAV